MFSPFIHWGSSGIHRILCESLLSTNKLWWAVSLGVHSHPVSTGALSYSSLYPQEPFIYKMFMEHLLYSRPYARYWEQNSELDQQDSGLLEITFHK